MVKIFEKFLLAPPNPDPGYIAVFRHQQFVFLEQSSGPWFQRKQRRPYAQIIVCVSCNLSGDYLKEKIFISVSPVSEL